MNNARRRRLRALIAACESLRDQLADLSAEEDRAQASMPQYIRMDWACIHLDQARAAAETAIAEMAKAMQ